MDTISNTEIEFFRSIRRTAAALLLIYRLNRPVLITEIASILNLDRKTAANQLKLLARQGTITHTRAGWIMTQGGAQLILPINHDPELMGKNSPREGKNSPLLPSTSTTPSLPLQYVEVEEEENRGEKFPILATLAQYGIGPTPKILNLIELPHITPEYIDAQAHRLKREKRFSTGLLITVLLAADPLPLTDEEMENRRRFRSFSQYNQD